MLRKIIILAVMFTALTLSVPVLADEPSPTPTEVPSPTPTPDPYTRIGIASGSTDVNTIMYYYHNVLNDEQRKIANFLIGSYNYMYLDARGFRYKDTSSLQDYIDKFNEFVNELFGFEVSGEYKTNSSRWSTNFQMYLQSIITYAGNTHITFENWLNNDLSKIRIKYDDSALNAWTEFYNDPSNSGVANFGASEDQFSSGTNFMYSFGDYSFAFQNDATRYSDFLLNYSPVCYSDVSSVYSGYKYQYIISLKDQPFVDSIYIKRSEENMFSDFRIGTSEGSFPNNFLYAARAGLRLSIEMVYVDVTNNGLSENVITWKTGIQHINNTSLDNIIDIALNFVPFNENGYNMFQNMEQFYTYYQHVYLVDDLNTLTNKVEIFKNSDLGIEGGSQWILSPKTNMPYWWKPIDFDIDIEQPDGSMEPSSDDDFTQNTVNNTVINNYDIVAPGVTINVPVNWFDGDYLEYTYNTGLPFFVFVGDVFGSLGELRIIILGVLIFGLVSGIIVKFLQ